MNQFLITYAALLLAGPAHAASTATLAGIDVYRSDRITIDEIRSRYGDEFKALVQKKNLSDRSKASEKLAAEIESKIEEDVKRTWKVPWAKLSWTEKLEAEDRRAYVVIDVVEAKDMATRMPFRPAGSKTFADPQGLFALREQYVEQGSKLVREQATPANRGACRAVYCEWFGLTPELKELDDKIAEAAAANESQLARILTDDKDPKHRAAAVYALAYVPNPNQVIHLVAPGLEDPDVDVRMAALAVFADLAAYHSDAYLPTDALLGAIDYPHATERTKALGVLLSLATNSYYGPTIVRHAGERLLELLRMHETNHDLAYTVLTLVSKQSFPATDYDAWKAWLEKAKTESGVALPKAEKK